MKKIYRVLVTALLTLAGGQMMWAQCTATTVPHFEGFNVAANNQLPPCWAATSPGNACLTFTQGYAGFAPGTNFFFSRGFSLNAGVVYSVSIRHQLSPGTANNWQSISLSIGMAQSQSGLTQLASAAPTQTFYTPL